MRNSLKAKSSNRNPTPPAKAVNWSTRRAKALMAYRSAGKASNCGK